MKKFIFVVTISSLFLSLNANAKTLSNNLCNQISNALNENYPQKIDRDTTLFGTLCVPGPFLIYNYRVPNSINSLNQSFEKRVENGWCTNPQTYNLLEKLKGIRLSYYKEDGKFIDTIHIDKGDC